MIKKTILLSSITLLTFCQSAQASIDGWLIGLEAGYGQTDFSAGNQGLSTFMGARLGPTKTSSDNDGFAGRAFLGYQFVKYAAVEVGFTKFSNAKINNIYGVTGANVKYKPQAGDIVGKAILPFYEDYQIFAKAGVAAARTNTSANTAAKAIMTPAGAPKLPTSDTKFRPVYGIGVGKELAEDFTLTVTWTEIVGNRNSVVEDTTFVGIGLTYYFG